MSPLLQALLVGAIVLVAALSVFRRLAPGRAWQLQARFSYALERSPGGLGLIGRWLRPPIVVRNDCSSGCARCNGCG